MGSRSVSQVFQQFQAARTTFSQAISELANRPDCVEQLLNENMLSLLPGLLGDVSPTVQQNAAIAVGRLASHSPAITDLVIRSGLLTRLISIDQEKPNRYLKRAILTSLKTIVKQTPEMAKSVIDAGGLDFAVGGLEEFDSGVKEAAAGVLGQAAKHSSAVATEVIAAGGVPLLVLALQEPDLSVRIVAANALSDISKHTALTAQAAVDAGAVAHLVRASGNPDTRLRRAALHSLASIAKHSTALAEIVVEADIFPLALEHAGHPDELVRRAATSLIKEVVKHTPDLAKLVVEGGGLGVLVNSVVRNKGEGRLPPVLALGYIAGHSPALGFSVIYCKGVDALALALSEEGNNPVGAAAAWSLGHVARHSDEHAKHVTSLGILPSILEVYTQKGASEEMRIKAKQALKMILLRTDDLESVEPLLCLAPPEIFKYVVALYSKILPNNQTARRNFVTSGGLRKIQELLTPETPEILKDHINLINACYPPDIVGYFSPNYPQTLLDRIDSYSPILNIDPSMWTDKLFSDTKIPEDLRQEIAALQKSLYERTGAGGPLPSPSTLELGEEEEDEEEDEEAEEKAKSGESGEETTDSPAEGGGGPGPGGDRKSARRSKKKRSNNNPPPPNSKASVLAGSKQSVRGASVMSMKGDDSKPQPSASIVGKKKSGRASAGASLAAIPPTPAPSASTAAVVAE